MKKLKASVPDAERCETENVSKILAKRCPKRAVATVEHPGLKKPYRCCKTHASDYTTGVQLATGWRVTWDATAKEN